VTAMQEAGAPVPMIHYECQTCGMTATCVVTPASGLAWHDHMAVHALVDNYRAWTWAVLPLTFDA